MEKNHYALLLIAALFLAACETTPVVPGDINTPYSEAITDRADVNDPNIDSLIIKRPVPLFQPAPDYPRELKGSGYSGVARMSFIVEPDGSTGTIEVVSADNRYFAEQARNALKRWRFEPALSNDGPIAIRVRITIPFSESSEWLDNWTGKNRMSNK
jgi:TonB family protein